MNVNQKLDELCYAISTTELNCDVILDYRAVIKSWNLPYGEEILIQYCNIVAKNHQERYWGIGGYYQDKNLNIKKRGIIADLVGDGY